MNVEETVTKIEEKIQITTDNQIMRYSDVFYNMMNVQSFEFDIYYDTQHLLGNKIFKHFLNSFQYVNKPGTPYSDGTIYDGVNKEDGSGKQWRDQNSNGPEGPGAQQGTDAILIQDNETKQNRMYGYIIMASSVVVLAVLMVRISNIRSGVYQGKNYGVFSNLIN
jgi:hypothetical protein